MYAWVCYKCSYNFKVACLVYVPNMKADIFTFQKISKMNKQNLKHNLSKDEAKCTNENAFLDT